MKFALVLSALAGVASAQMMSVLTPRVNDTITAGTPLKFVIKARNSLTNTEVMAAGVKIVQGNRTLGGRVLGSGLLAGQDGGKTNDNSFQLVLPKDLAAGPYTLVINSLYYIGATQEAHIAYNKIPVHVKKPKKSKRALGSSSSSAGKKRSWGMVVRRQQPHRQPKEA